MEERIVKRALKVDLHIHSAASKEKDRDLVKDSNIDNVNVLIQKLKDNKIDMFSITDHDKFDYKLYKKFKEYKENTDKTFAKILPGVEFSVGIKSDDLDASNENIIKQIHVIAIFDDSNDSKLQKLEDLLNESKYDCVDNTSKQKMMFNENTFRNILQDTDMNVCLIAHQKNSVTSESKRNNDANSLGENKFNELINYEYFEAFEFKNISNRYFHELFKQKVNTDYEKVRFITGSDCHEWAYYPKHDKNSNDEFYATYIKCLPSFRGLVMALTDDSRIQLNDDFFSNTSNFLDNLRYSVDGKDYSIPLSKGINTIIGDNSKGKSMFLHALTNYSKSDIKVLSKSKKDEYIKYLDDNNIEIEKINEKLNYKFDSQGEIKECFGLGKFNDSSFLENLKPNKSDSSFIIKSINDYFNNYFDLLKIKFNYDNVYNTFKGKNINLNVTEDVAKSLNVTKATIKNDDLNLPNVIKELTNIISSLKELSKIIKVNEDKNYISETLIKFESMLQKYKNKKEQFDFKNKLINLINSGIGEFIKSQNKLQSTSQSLWTTFKQNAEDFAESIFKLINEKVENKRFNFDDFNSISPNYEIKNYDDMKIVCRFEANKEKYDSKYLENLLSECLYKNSLNKVLDIENITKDNLLKAIKNYDDKNGDPIEIIKAKIQETLNEDFETKMTILNANDNVFSDKSSGLNAINYFKVMSYDESGTIYIVDQPEDDVSQQNIRSNTIKDLKRMAKYKQIILVTHNPQLVVNLDSDNVIYFSDENGKLNIKSGALEFKDEEFDVIDCVSNCLEGGVESLKKRWKRYAKNIEND